LADGVDPSSAAPIYGEDILYRRIIHDQHDQGTGAISASAFMRKRKLGPEVSVYLARMTSPREILAAGLPGQLLIALKAQVAFDAGLSVVRQPTQEFPGHCVIVGFGETTWKEQCLRLAEGSLLVDSASEYARNLATSEGSEDQERGTFFGARHVVSRHAVCAI
jgi:hypothetical protein